jgi:hypothetical protein
MQFAFCFQQDADPADGIVSANTQFIAECDLPTAKVGATPPLHCFSPSQTFMTLGPTPACPPPNQGVFKLRSYRYSGQERVERGGRSPRPRTAPPLRVRCLESMRCVEGVWCDGCVRCCAHPTATDCFVLHGISPFSLVASCCLLILHA